MKQKLRTSFAVKQQNENLQLHGSLRVRLHGRFRSGGGSDVGNQQSSARRRRAWPKEKTHCKLFAPSAAAFLSPDMSFMTPLLILIFAYCMHIIVMLGLEHTHTHKPKKTLCAHLLPDCNSCPMVTTLRFFVLDSASGPLNSTSPAQLMQAHFTSDRDHSAS